MIIAIDGPAAAGKGTLAKKLAEYLKFAYLDTGALYRAVGWLAQEADVNLEYAGAVAALVERITPELLSRSVLRTESAGEAASKIAGHTEVRNALLDFQQEFANTPPNGMKGSILDGRDIGTVVCPSADLKLFITASPESRAMRRFKELSSRGQEVSYDEILLQVIARDKADIQRAVAPLKPAKDAKIIDTTSLSITEVFNKALHFVEQTAKSRA